MTRKARGAKTQVLLAEWFRNHGWPFATDAGAGRQGRDIMNMIGLAPECRARREFDPVTSLRQAETNAGDDLPFVVLRCNGQGPAAVDEWAVVMRLGHFTELLREAGYGDPIDEEKDQV